MKSLPIRIRLTLWYFLMFSTAALLLSLSSWWMLHRTLDATNYHELQERAEDVQLLLAHEPPGQSLAALQQEFDSIYSLKDDGKYLQILDQDGHWIFRSKRMMLENPALPPAGQLPKDGIQAEFHQGTHRVRILAYPIAAQGKKYSVQTGIALNRSQALLNTFGTDLLMLTPAVIFLASFGGHWMSRKALKPVAALTAMARQINDRNLDTRLPVPAAKDELSDLSHTLNQMLERIDKAFESVRAFTGNASHELRTPITLLRTEIEVALFRPRSIEEYRATLTRLHGETVRMTNLVETLLSLARTDGGAEAVVLMPIKVHALMEQVEETWKAAMQRALLDFRVDISPELSPDPAGSNLCVLGDPGGIPRLLSILLDNACKYTPPGGSVTLSVAPQGEQIVVTLRDTGIGIAPEHQERIFDRFFRAAPAADYAERGSGLGLALAKWIADRHGAHLQLESSPGHGSSFSFTLPKAVDAQASGSVVSSQRAK